MVGTYDSWLLSTTVLGGMALFCRLFLGKGTKAAMVDNSDAWLLVVGFVIIAWIIFSMVVLVRWLFC